MTLQAILTIIHILSAVVWLALIPADLVLRRNIRRSRGKSGEKRLISIYMYLVNLCGMIGMTGILITGIILISIIPYYFFFSFASNHWLATKQVIMVILLVLVFAFLIPTAKRVRGALGADLENNLPLSADSYNNLKKLETIITISNVLVLINFLLAITHRYIA
ncbi:MAG: hypothetical protein ACM3S2_21835 [Ignavibacteriales bacterium]